MGGPRISLGRAWSIARRAIHLLRDRVPSITPVGSLRRFEPTVGDIALLAVTPSPDTLLDSLADISEFQVLHRTPAQCSVRIERDEVTLHTSVPEAAGAALLHYTGSRGHTVELVRRAEARGLELGPHGIRWRATRAAAASASEADVYGLLDLPFIEPELRQGHQEIEAAEAGALPALVGRGDIRGDLHMHSRWSDGQSSVERMVERSVALGYDYIAITDHSQTAKAAGGLTPDMLARQRLEIEALRERFAGITILHGSEVDILPDGRLDFPDELLAGLDIVLASLHDAAGQDGRQLTDRYLAAMRHPLVNIITHPTNRMIGHRGGYVLDFPALFAAAVQTGTAIEIDGAPAHLDMDGAVARRAVEAGVTVSIDSDCHRASWLNRQMTFGIGTARRGWVEARHVLNARPVAEVRAFVAHKRRS
jgi:DNA polymerase (family 10)